MSRRIQTRVRRTVTAERRSSSARERSVSRAAVVATRAATLAGLRYVESASPGLTRVRSGRGFRYVDTTGRLIRDGARLDRIRRLAIPPAWRNVWICTSMVGHLQATGRDAKGRKQYRYHARWREIRDSAKYEHMVDFARRLPALRARIARDLRARGLTKRKVVAAIVRLLEATLIRVGNEEYARQNRSFGLTTLRDRHASVAGSRLRFRFRGKSGREHVVSIADRGLGRVVRRCQELPGQSLFQYQDERGRRRTVGSSDVNGYLREATGADFTAKDFRTWAGTILAASALYWLKPAPGKTQANRNVVRAIREVAGRLGNTPAICRRCYVHPTVIEAYLDGSLRALRGLRERADRGRTGLSPGEACVRALLAARHSAAAARNGHSQTPSRAGLSSTQGAGRRVTGHPSRPVA